jgi:hypothetical protein
MYFEKFRDTHSRTFRNGCRNFILEYSVTGVFWSAASVICRGDFLTHFATVYVGQEHVRFSKVWIQYYFTLFILASRATAGQIFR